MRRLLVSLLLVVVTLAGSLVGVARAMPRDIAEATILETEAAFAQAQLVRDPAAAAALLREDFVLTLANGQTVDKESFVASLKTWWHPKSIDTSDQIVRLEGDTAIVTGKLHTLWPDENGVIQDTTEQFTDIYLKEHGIWLKWATHLSCVSGRCS